MKRIKEVSAVIASFLLAVSGFGCAAKDVTVTESESVSTSSGAETARTSKETAAAEITGMPETTESTAETSETQDRVIIVQDYSSDSIYNDYLEDYIEVHIPEVIIGDLDLFHLNLSIRKVCEGHYYDVSRSAIDYEYFIGEDTLSLNISIIPYHDESPSNSYAVYVISLSDGHVMSREEIIDVCGIDEDLLNRTVESDIRRIWEEQELGDHMLDEAMSEDSIKKAYPFYKPDGELYYVMNVGIPAGSGELIYEAKVD